MNLIKKQQKPQQQTMTTTTMIYQLSPRLYPTNEQLDVVENDIKRICQQLEMISNEVATSLIAERTATDDDERSIVIKEEKECEEKE